MSVYKQGVPKVKDAAQVRDYILRFNRQVSQLFSSLVPDENFTDLELEKYLQTDMKLAVLENGIDGFRVQYEDFEKKVGTEFTIMDEKIDMKVKSGDVVNQLNLENEDICISGNRLEIYMKNLVLDENNNLIAAGKVVAEGGHIAGWSIEKSGTHQYWKGDSTSRIDVSRITAQSGSAGTITCTGETHVNATMTGNFGTVATDRDTLFDGGFSCSCMNGAGNDISCGTLVCIDTYRDAGESIPSSPEHPSKDDGYEYPNRYNLNDLPYGGLVTDYVSCRSYYSKLAGVTWSDRRLKRDIQDITCADAMELLSTIRPVQFRFKRSGFETCGYIAQEVPQAFTERTPGGFLGIRQMELAVALDAALKWQSERIRRAVSAYGQNGTNQNTT